MNYREYYEQGAAMLGEAGVPEAKLDARLLLEYVCGTDCQTLLVHGDRELTKQEQERYSELLAKRSRRVPLQHLTGEQSFYGLSFLVNEHVLIPRQDTEILVEAALGYLKEGMTLLDMCTGSGCILISLLAKRKGVMGMGADISGEALLVAAENGRRLLGENEQPLWVESDLFQAVPKEFRADVIVSNPPYIASREVDELMPEVREHEPRRALDGSEDGLLFYRKIVRECAPYLKAGGHLLFEIGFDQGEEVSALMVEAGFEQVKVRKDYAGLDRVVEGQKSLTV